jgi:hypothetical protein
MSNAPFSKRFSVFSKEPIQNDFPMTARIALSYILQELIDNGYIGDNLAYHDKWKFFLTQLCKDAREPFDRIYENDIDYMHQALEVLYELPWYRVYEFCETIYSYLLPSQSMDNQKVA